ncbi:MAG: hypothetical protein ACT4N2_03350 [Hyphomicrobium sp.]
MPPTTRFLLTLLAAAVGSATFLLVQTSHAANVRDHRGEKTLQVAPVLGCGSYKPCRKSGAIVRDHRNGAAPGGK